MCVCVCVCTHINNGILLSYKKELNNAISSNMNRPRDYCTKWRKSERERQIPYDITYAWNLKHDTNDLTHETGRLTNGENRLVIDKCGRGGMAGSLGLADQNNYVQNGETEKSCCIPQGTIFNIVW